ncbi:MAG: DUF1365 domain-containing protein [Rhodocyclaceae bacterium]|nr:DUF1365 domain-containing protein [Rhodocyclaceae bacterium]
MDRLRFPRGRCAFRPRRRLGAGVAGPLAGRRAGHRGSRVTGLAYPAGVCFGAVMHRRLSPVEHRFVYPTATLRLPLSALDALHVPWLGIDRPHVFSFRSADHGPGDGSPLLPWLRQVLARHGVASVCDGEVVLQTLPRQFGYVFNPVSFWFCHGRDGRLRVVLAEVNNTFGERHCYLVHHADQRPIVSGESLRARKCFHVSPFLPVRGEYRFRFDFGAQGQSVSVDVFDGGVPILNTRIGGRPEPLTGAAMGRWLLRFPWMTAAVIVRIHWQALQLWLRRVPIHRKPQPPTEEFSR